MLRLITLDQHMLFGCCLWIEGYAPFPHSHIIVKIIIRREKIFENKEKMLFSQCNMKDLLALVQLLYPQLSMIII